MSLALVGLAIRAWAAGHIVKNDRLGPEEFREKLDWALERIRETDALMRSGELRCNPDSCAWNGGCMYPSICRSDG